MKAFEQNKPTILYMIDSLAVGGAEILFVNLLPELSELYNVVLVTLYDQVEFEGVEQFLVTRYSINYKGYIDTMGAADRLKKIISQHKPDLVHSHLFWSTVIGRLGCPKHVPFYFSVHATLDDDSIPFYKSAFISITEKITYKRHQNMIGVTQAVIDTFKKVHGNTGRTELLYNYVRDEFFKEDYRFSYHAGKPLRLVAVNNLRLIKNVPYMVEAMKALQNEPVTLDIYGDGNLRDDLIAMIESYGLRSIRLMGKRTDIHKVLTGYDVFVSASTVEGFGISVAEAMATGLPVIISEIPVYKEIAGDNAMYIDNQHPESLIKLIRNIMTGGINLQQKAEESRKYAQMKFSKREHMLRLQQIYHRNLEKS